MPKIDIKKGDELERALKRFKMKLRSEGIMDEMKKREFYEKPSERRRREGEVAKRKEWKRRKESE
ncbi:30S ribosomal protein S21 [candidate division WOR-1 bacterium RIFOXYB2_FULL_48_7]|uniref:Small ribosomal subunit protein bS21 n=1 Tax=candidate division WOR-1 bacterium RIFOXYB2_FULL_48_7 TaxID=1802583 RepID=A0A1F4TRX0_UNCSA|nr:MAG: 30S ribosomal protein S21 [candidate division WOR-1 bacterium RIFOXYB2_FULL_48_7]